MREVEWETLKWVDWYNNRRLLGPIGYIPPAEPEEAFHANLNSLDRVAWPLNKSPSGKAGAVQSAFPRPSGSQFSERSGRGENSVARTATMVRRGLGCGAVLSASGDAVDSEVSPPRVWLSALPVQRHDFGSTFLPFQLRRDHFANLVSRNPEGIGRRVRIASRCLYILVPQTFADQQKGCTVSGHDRGEGRAQIVRAHIGQPRAPLPMGP